MTTSTAIILLYAAAGEVHSALGIVSFQRGWVLILFLWMAFFWFFWRFNSYASKNRILFIQAAYKRLEKSKDFLNFVFELEKNNPTSDIGENPHIRNFKRDTKNTFTCQLAYRASGRSSVSGQITLRNDQCRRFRVKSILHEAYDGEDFATTIAPYLFAFTAVLVGACTLTTFLFNTITT